MKGITRVGASRVFLGGRWEGALWAAGAQVAGGGSAAHLGGFDRVQNGLGGVWEGRALGGDDQGPAEVRLERDS